MRTPAALAGLLGGLCWLAAFAVDATAGGRPVDALTWAGVALLAVAVLGAGASLVSRGATGLRVVVAVCFLALVGSVLEVVRAAGDPVVVDAVFGLGVLVVSVVALGRRRGSEAPAPSRHSRGSHAR